MTQLKVVFERSVSGAKSAARAKAKLEDLKDRRIRHLEAKLVQKNEVISELMEDNVKSKKAFGDL